MKTTARELIKRALVKCKAISPSEDPSFEEVSGALAELNGMIAIFNRESNWRFSYNRIDKTLVSGLKSFTIGLGDGKRIVNIQSVDADNTKITFSSNHGYNVGDSVSVYDTESFDVSNQAITAVTPKTITIPNPDSTAYATESTGVVYEEGDTVPDIRAERPDKIESIRITTEGATYVLKYYVENEFDSMVRVDQTSTRPGYYTYYNNFPFGKIVFNALLDSNYDFTIKYRADVRELALDNQVDLPDGYYHALLYNLADHLQLDYGLNDPAITMKAMQAKESITKYNYKPSVLRNYNTGTWDFESGDYI